MKRTFKRQSFTKKNEQQPFFIHHFSVVYSRMKPLIICFSLLFGMAASVQAQYIQAFSVNVGGGLSSLQYTPVSGSQKPGLGMSAGLGYAYFFLPQWGVRVGLGVSTFSASTTMDNYSQSYLAVTSLGKDFVFNYTYTDYKEEQYAVLLTIPVMALYEYDMKSVQLCGALGFKMGIPVSGSYTISNNGNTASNLATSGYFPDINVTYYGDSPELGFANYNVNRTADLDLKTAFMLSAEAGVKKNLSKEWSLYAGLYFDYGFTSIAKNSDNAELIGYQTEKPSEFTYTSVAANKLKPLAFGITLRATFGIDKPLF